MLSISILGLITDKLKPVINKTKKMKSSEIISFYMTPKCFVPSYNV